MIFQLYSATYKRNPDQFDFLSGVNAARQICNDEPDNPFHANAFSELVARANEKFDEDARFLSMLPEAIDRILSAIHKKKDYAKFYQTQARLLSLNREFRLAAEAAQRAIDTEDSSIADYFLRIQTYATTLLEIEIKRMRVDIDKKLSESNSEIQKTASKIESELEKSKSNYVEALALFAAVVSFILSSISISVQFEPIEAIYLIIGLGGIIIFSFLSFSATMTRFISFHRILFDSVVALTLIIVGIVGLNYERSVNEMADKLSPDQIQKGGEE